jgi:hypothetical protein
MWMNRKFLKKESVKLKEIKEVTFEDIIGQLTELKTNAQYVLWFKRMLHPNHIQTLRDSFKHNGIKIHVICGIEVPEIYEFEKDVNESNGLDPVNC